MKSGVLQPEFERENSCVGVHVLHLKTQPTVGSTEKNACKSERNFQGAKFGLKRKTPIKA